MKCGGSYEHLLSIGRFFADIKRYPTFAELAAKRELTTSSVRSMLADLRSYGWVTWPNGQPANYFITEKGYAVLDAMVEAQ